MLPEPRLSSRTKCRQIFYFAATVTQKQEANHEGSCSFGNKESLSLSTGIGIYLLETSDVPLQSSLYQRKENELRTVKTLLANERYLRIELEDEIEACKLKEKSLIKEKNPSSERFTSYEPSKCWIATTKILTKSKLLVTNDVISALSCQKLEQLNRLWAQREWAAGHYRCDSNFKLSTSCTTLQIMLEYSYKGFSQVKAKFWWDRKSVV